MKKILIIEKDLQTAELEKDYLELSNFEVTITSDGMEGAQMAMSGGYDMLLLGTDLPEKDGFEICEEYRNNFLKPVIFVSDKNEDRDIIHGLKLGADDYITKPFSPSELVARVKAHINRYESFSNRMIREEMQKEYVSVGDIELDRVSHTVYVKKKEKILTCKEFDLLFYLASNPNRVLSKADLFREIWGPYAKGDSATVTVHIKKIREKIEEEGSDKNYIETIWGAGYRFNA